MRTPFTKSASISPISIMMPNTLRADAAAGRRSASARRGRKSASGGARARRASRRAGRGSAAHRFHKRETNPWMLPHECMMKM